MRNDVDFMHMALVEARAALATGNLPVGAVVTINDSIVGTGRRTAKSLGKLDHGEMLAVQQAYHDYPKAFKSMVVYSTLEPCMMCFGTILNCRIPEIVYAFPDSYGGATRIPLEALPPRHRDNVFTVVRDVLWEESRLLLREFFETTEMKFWHDRENPLVAAVYAGDHA